MLVICCVLWYAYCLVFGLQVLGFPVLLSFRGLRTLRFADVCFCVGVLQLVFASLLEYGIPLFWGFGFVGSIWIVVVWLFLGFAFCGCG